MDNGKKIVARQTDIDVLKAIGIIMVLCGHFIEPYRKVNGIFDFIYIYIYLFHMPLFCFLSGIVAKCNIKKIFLQTGWLYVLTCVGYYAFRVLVLGELFTMRRLIESVTYPWWHLWYLEAIIIWEISVNFIKKVRFRWLLLVISVVIAFVSGYFELPWLLSRVVVFYPFYLVGFLYRKEIVDYIVTINKEELFIKKVTGIAITVLLGVLIGIFRTHVNTQSFYNWQSYGAGDYSIYERMIFFAGAMLMIWAVFHIFMQNKNGVLLQLGMRTLPVYILHAIVFWGSRRLCDSLVGKDAEGLIILYVCVGVVGCVIVFSSNRIKRLMDMISSIWYKKCIDMEKKNC